MRRSVVMAGVMGLLWCVSSVLGATTLTGAYDSPETLMQWHKVTLTIDGPSVSENDTSNPFMNYRMNVTFTHSATGTSYLVPGYFAADGNAANTGATSGDQWRAHLSPDYAGQWTYTVSFRSGTNVAVNDSVTAGTALSPYNGISGSFDVLVTDKTGPDLRAKGRLQYVGGHYLQFKGNGEYFLKQGADAPENFLAYQDFDGDFKSDGQKDDLIKTWSAHTSDWTSGDPVWQSSKGKGIIGAINYLASEGMNAFSFLTMNINGDDRNVFPYTSYSERYRMDCSRLDQWGLVFEHGTKKGMFLHFKTQETENELLLDSGNVGNSRKLYYRELIARFSHNLALNWNLGEEINNASTAQKKAWAQYFYDHDPYHHHIVIHNMNVAHYELLGTASKLTGFSLQTSNSDFSAVYDRVLDYVDRSAAAGKKWAVACDEPGDAQHSLRPDDDAGNSHTDGRKNALWGTFMAGGYGNEWYFGYQHDNSDLTCQDFRSRDSWWDYCRYALNFWTQNDIPVQNMVLSDGRVNTGWCRSGQSDLGAWNVVVYLKNGGTVNVNLPAGNYTKVLWFNPRTGSTQQLSAVSGGQTVSFTASSTDDWALLIQQPGDLTAPTPDPAQFVTVPYALNDTTVSMTAVTGSDPESGGVEYYFTETTGHCHGQDSGWQSDPTYTLTGLASGTDYAFSVKMRNGSGVQTAASAAMAVTTTGLPDIVPPTPSPAAFLVYPVATGSAQITMQATEGTDASGSVEYYFDEVSGNSGGNDSGWQSSPVYTDEGLASGTQYSYKVKMRDGSCNETDFSGAVAATTSVPQEVTLTFNPTEDAYKEGSSFYNNTQLKVEADNRVSYLQFDVSGIPDDYDVTSVTLKLTENGDPGNGTLRFYKGSHSNWTESNISSNTPATDGEVANWSGTVAEGQAITVTLDSLVTANDTYTLIIKMDSGGNDVWFGSSESGSTAPILTVAAESNGPVDSDPPTPDPAVIDTYSSTDTSLTVTALTGTDALTPPVEYLFDEISGSCGAQDSQWQYSPVYTMTDLAPGTDYGIKVVMRDAAGNQTQSSDVMTITTTGTKDVDPPAPVAFAVGPMAISRTEILMTAVTATDENGPVEYYFDEISGHSGGSDSGWQTDPSYTDTGLTAGTEYVYSLHTRDAVCNESYDSSPVSVYTQLDTDIDASGVVDTDDLIVMANNWLMQDCFNNNLCQGSDIDATGRVDYGDFEMLAVDWGLVKGSTPYSGIPMLIPGKIEAEYYDLGGEGLAFHDTSTGNSGNDGGNDFRMDEAVDVQPTEDTGGGYNVGWIDAGEWLNYTVDVTAGVYDVAVRVASPKDAAGSLILTLDDVVIADFAIPNTGDWQQYQTLVVEDVIVQTGVGQKLRATISDDTIGYNINYIEIGEDLAEDTPADPVTLVALTDFPNIEVSGFAPAYKDNTRGALAVDASLYKDVYAAAQTSFSGGTGVYDVTIHTLGESDGESTYKLAINGTVVGTYQNTQVYPDDYVSQTCTWEDISISSGATIQVQFNSHSNGLVAEDGGWAYSRGRWTKLELVPQGDVEESGGFNPVVYLPFYEAAGTVTADIAGGYDGTLTNMDDLAWQDGTMGGALSFDGVDDYVQLTGYKGISGGASRTCAAWIKTSAVSGEILSWGDSVAGGKWIVRVNEDGQLRTEVQGGYIIGTTLINDDMWHHIAVVLENDGSPDIDEVKLYVDGQLEAISASAAEQINTVGLQDVQIGLYTVGQRYFNGLIDDVRIYDVALSADVISDLSGEEIPVVHIPMYEGVDIVASDIAGGYDGMLTNMDDLAWQDGKIGGALIFDGVDDYVQLTGYKGITGGASRTCAAWIKTSAVSGEILSWGDSADGGKWIVRVNEGGQLRAEVQGGNIVGTTIINDNVWHHVAVVVENDGSPDINEAKLYVDGQLEVISASVDEPVNTGASQDVQIGLYTVGQRYFKGLIDDVRIYDVALSDDQIAFLAGDDGGSTVPTGVYVEEDGLLVMECENTETADLGQWQLMTPGTTNYNSGATNDAHLEFTGNGINGGDADSPLKYRFNIAKAGNYYLHIRARKRLDGEESDKCNDCYIKMGGDSFTSGSSYYGTSALTQDTKLYGGTASGWGWASDLDGNGADHKPVIYNFPAGTYELTMSGRSIRFQVDRIVLHHSSISESDAQKTSNSESLRGQ